MIMFQKTNPVGVDYFVNRSQVLEQRELPDQFEVSEALCLFYGRAEMIEGKPNVYTKENRKHQPIGIDSKKALITYFVVTSIDPDNLRDNVTTTFYCHGNLELLYPSITHRADEEFRRDIKAFILKQIEPQDFNSIELIQDSELQPFHSFKLNFIIR